MSLYRNILACLLLMEICFLFASKASAEDKSKNKWIDVKIKSKPLNAKQFEAFLTVPKDAESLEALYAAVTGNGVYYSPDSGNQWINIGLKDTTVYQFAIHHQQNSKTLYACTNKGLLRLNRDTKRFVPVSMAFQDSQVVAITFDSKNADLIYVATPKTIFRSSNNDTAWHVLKMKFTRIDIPQIRAVVIVPDSSDLLLAGTDQGIHKIRIKGEVAACSDTIQGSLKNVNFFIACEYAKQQTLIAATENKGVFYSRAGEIWAPGENWAPMNIGLSHSFSSIVSLSVDQKSATKSCFAAFKDGTIKKYRLAGLQVGIFNIYSSTASLWETRRISDHLFFQLSAPNILDIARVDTSLNIAREDVRKRLENHPKLKNYNKILVGVVSLFPPVAKYAEERREIKIEINAYNVHFDSLAFSSKYTSEQDDFETYYPHQIDQLAKKIKEKEFGIEEPSWLYQCFWNGWRRKLATGAGIIGVGVLGVLALSSDKTSPDEAKTKLPFPPSFPDKGF